MNIYITGFMGTGKTAVAQELARRTRRTCVDLDEAIESRQHHTIAEIFAQRGEPYFRQLEKNALQEFSLRDNQVVSCGGGIVIDPQNIERMKRSGVIVCLRARPEVILRRTQNFTHRPLLRADDPLAKIRQLLEERAGYYAQADTQIDTSDLSVPEVVQQIRNFLDRRP